MKALGKQANNEAWSKVLRECGLDRWDAANDKDKDKLSHFVLRIAYCSTEDLRRWLMQQETALFKYRFDQLTFEDVNSFFHNHKISFEEVPADEVDELTPELMKIHKEVAGTIYKIPFEQALSLVQARRVYLRAGWAFVPRTELSSIVVAQFRAHLSKELALTFRNLQSMRRDSRVQPIINSLSKQYTATQYKAQAFAGKVTPDQIPMLAKRSFPLCMDNLFDHLSSDSHLRHSGRMQFGLFIKALGMEMEDALAFWQRAFSKRIPADKFAREYAYNIRHMYGKEGKRTAYTPYSCSYIINHGPSGTAEYHGCPFRHFDESHLRAKLLQKRITSEGIEDIVRLVRGTHYQIACQKYYSLTHNNVENPKVGMHPNSYVTESMKHYQDDSVTGGAGGAASASAATPGAATASASAAGGASDLTDEDLEALMKLEEAQ
jgi:DNA primase large subunit